MTIFQYKNLCTAIVLSAALLFSGCRKEPVPGNIQRPPVIAPGSNQNIPSIMPGSSQDIPATTPGSSQDIPATTPGSNQEIPVTTPGGSQDIPTTTPDSNQEIPATTPQEIPSTTPTTQTDPTIPQETHSTEETIPSAIPEETSISAEELEFPISLENDGLLLMPPFTYDGLNPDCDNTEGRNIAAVTMKNCSGRHLISAEFTLVLVDGTEIPFRIEHIPSGRQVTAFALDNTQIPSGAKWSQVLVTAQFAETVTLREQGLSIQENGTHVDLSNDTGTDLTNLMIYCHNLLGEEYFGGTAYSYNINNIPAGAAASVDALDCILGIAEVTYATGNQE